MGSSRLPGKVVRPLAGRPMLEWIISRLKRSKLINRLIIATSHSPSEDPIVDLAQQRHVPVFRGSELDVLDRYYQCACQYGLKHIVRATGDNPFVDPVECDRLIELYQSEVMDYASAFPEFGSGFPKGVGLEVFSFSALQKSWQEGTAPHHREHVNEYIQEKPNLFRQAVLGAPESKFAPDLSLTVDTAADFEKADSLYRRFLLQSDSDFVPVEWVVADLNS